MKDQHRREPVKFLVRGVLTHVEDLGHASRPFVMRVSDTPLMAEEGSRPQCLERRGPRPTEKPWKDGSLGGASCQHANLFEGGLDLGF
jgi:hypothetical protein